MSKAKILVVDHDPKFSRLLAAILNHAGAYEARVENGSSNVLDTAREFRPRLIVLNANMDEKDGTAISLEIRSDSILFKVPIIYVIEAVSKAGHEVPAGVLSVSKFVSPRHFLNMVRAACPQLDQGATASRSPISAFASRKSNPLSSKNGKEAAAV